jgi:O-antigen ligase
MLDDWNRKVIPEYWKKMAYIANFICNLDFIVYLATFIIFFLHVIRIYIKSDEKDRVFIHNLRYPFTYLSSPNYEIILVIQILQSICMCTVDSLSMCLLTTCVITMNF